VPAAPEAVEAYIHEGEEELPVRPDNASRILWANDSLRQRTGHCLLYLHGFSGSWYEGYPTHTTFAGHFGMNAYMPRLAAHGIETEDPLLDMTPDRLWASAKEALVVARSLGRSVIIMGTSTGGTLALKLAAEFQEYVDGLILFSPNIRINNGSAFFLSKPWGLQMARSVYGGKYRVTSEDTASADCRYWYCRYRLEALVYLQQLLDATMDEATFGRVTVPVFLGYYYKDAEHQDPVVKVDAMLKMFDQLGTSPGQKIRKAFPEAGEHVIGCELTSGAVDEVIRETLNFGRDILQLPEKN
jgi:esterase/lipase